MKLRISRPALLVDVGRLSDLRYIREDGDRIAIGALTRHADIEKSELLQRECGLLAYTAGLIGDPQVRHRGHDRRHDRARRPRLRHADRAARARRRDRRARARRRAGRSPAAEFFRGVYETALGPQDVRHGDPRARGSTAPAGRTRSSSGGRRTGRPSASPPCVRNGGARGRRSRTWARRRSGRAASRARSRGDRRRRPPRPPPRAPSRADEVNASAEFKRHLARVLVRRALEEAISGS